MDAGLRADHVIVLAAGQQVGEALKSASEELRADHKIVLLPCSSMEMH